MNPKVLIQIAILEDGSLGVTSTTNNQITNFGMLEAAKAFFMSTLQKKEESEIIKPRFEV